MGESVSSTISRQVVEKLPQGVVVVDSEGQCCWANKALFTLLGSESCDLVGLSDEQHIQLKQWLSSVEVDTADGSTLKKTCIELTDGSYAFLFERQQLENGIIDPLTGIATRLSISIALDTLLSVARRYEKPLSVGLVQVNNLEKLPHDQALLALSQCLKDELRWADLVGRNGDNSFIIVLPETDQQAADVLQEKLERVLSHACFVADEVEPDYQVVILESNKRDDTERLLARLEAQLIG